MKSNGLILTPNKAEAIDFRCRRRRDQMIFLLEIVSVIINAKDCFIPHIEKPADPADKISKNIKK